MEGNSNYQDSLEQHLKNLKERFSSEKEALSKILDGLKKTTKVTPEDSKVANEPELNTKKSKKRKQAIAQRIRNKNNTHH